MNSSPRKLYLRQYPFIFLLAGIIPGIMLQEQFRFSREFWLIAFMICFAWSLLFHFLRRRGRYFHIIRTIGLWLSLLFAGGLLRCYEDIRYDSDWYGNYIEQSEAFLVEVIDEPELKPATLYLPVRVMKYNKSGKWTSTAGLLNIYLYHDKNMPEFQKGDRLIIPCDMRPTSGSRNPYGFDYGRHLAYQNVFHQSFLSHNQIIRIPGLVATDRSGQIRQTFRNSLERNIRDRDTRALAAAILLNQRTQLDNTLLQAYSITGITHIIAISGMHVSLLFGIFLVLLKWIRHRKYAWIKYALAVPLVWAYILLTDFPPSAVRAGIMFSFLAIGIASGKPMNSINVLAATGFALFCIKPAWLYDVGVQLSFLAVLSILIFYKPISTQFRTSNFLLKILWNIIALSLAAQILVFPLVIYYFHQFPIWVLPANVPAAFFSLLLMLGSLLILVLDMLHIPAYWLGDLLAWMTEGFHYLIYFFSDHAPAFSKQLYLDTLEFWLLILSITGAGLFIFIKFRPAIYGAALLISFLLGRQISKDYVSRQQEKLVVYDINRKSLADYFKGKQVWSIGGARNATDEKVFRYTLFPSRLGHRAVQSAGQLNNGEAFLIGNKRILYLLDPFPISDKSERFKVDFLILSTQQTLRAEEWISCFRPEKIILDGSFPRWKARKWESSLKSKNIPVHNVNEKGAWCFPGSE